MKRLFATLLCLPGLALASTGSFTDSGVFTTVPGYGYEIKGSYFTNVATFSVFSDGADQYDRPYFDKRIFAGATLWPDVPGSPETVDVSVTLDVRFVNLATGQTEFPSHLLNRSAIEPRYIVVAEGKGSGKAEVVTPWRPVTRLSESTLTQSWSISDQLGPLNGNGGNVGYKRIICTHTGHCDDVLLASAAVHLEFNASFNAGSWLMPSLDPTCVGCMVQGRDTLWLNLISVGVSVSAVPEPSTDLLFTLGVAGLLAYSRRLAVRR